MKRALKTAASLTLPMLLSACASQHVVTAEELCRDWRHQTVGKDDVLTQKTAAGILAANSSRTNWGCKFGKNEAKKS